MLPHGRRCGLQGYGGRGWPEDFELAGNILDCNAGVASMALAMTSFCSVKAGGRPPSLPPCTGGARNPAVVRSRMTERSNSASARKSEVSLPPAVVVSMASVSERKPMPRECRSSPCRSAGASNGPASPLPDRRRLTRRACNRGPLSAGAGHAVRQTLSSNSFSHPAARSASSCRDVSCSWVETRA